MRPVHRTQSRRHLVMTGLGWSLVVLPGVVRDFGNARILMFLGGVGMRRVHRRLPHPVAFPHRRGDRKPCRSGGTRRLVRRDRNAGSPTPGGW